MGFFSRFRRKQASSIQPFLHDQLGELSWSKDADGWVGTLPYGKSNVEIYLGSGSVNEYPSSLVCELLATVAENIGDIEPAALQYLHNEAKDHFQPSADFVLSGLETYEHYASDNACSLTYSDGSADDVWRVNLVNGVPESVGRDD